MGLSILILLLIISKLHETDSFLQSPMAGTVSKSAVFPSSSSCKLHAIAVDVNSYPDSKRRLTVLQKQVESNLAPDVLNLKFLTETVKDMEQESSQAGFWDDQDKAQAVLSEMNRCKIHIL